MGENAAGCLRARPFVTLSAPSFGADQTEPGIAMKSEFAGSRATFRVIGFTGLLVAVLASGACKPTTESADKQFGLCEMDAIKNMGYRQGDWDGPAGRYLYACMRAAGFDPKSRKTPQEGYCTFGDMRRIVLPECYQSKH